MGSQGDLLHGTVDVLILKALVWGPRHGYAISEWLHGASAGTLQVDGAALYQALHRLQRHKAVESEWGLSANNRRARYYRLTRKGQALLRTDAGAFRKFAQAVFTVLDAEGSTA